MLKTKERIIARSIKKQIQYIKKILIKSTTVLTPRIGKINK